ncbi:hypothetical protein DTO166G4_2879 [Paecilomyces variotii]|nr:hypothetical protein DTO032I3_7034 [Paecilomyces variotii]KAJ9206681.1 hypothetical protein DTO164E3_922 [Paecilomyces variotii]KAJ9215509.1 hypothetical protein DTO166G4_2879 [Paecilomyces variotii]KAJ9233189.1 hypothetical protein DTO166G5_5777 [Paecilomyces variotii]KAJ9257365.1 hypothetical protein DTO207G8_2119 [Paecilomyces variotii]
MVSAVYTSSSLRLSRTMKGLLHSTVRISSKEVILSSILLGKRCIVEVKYILHRNVKVLLFCHTVRILST